MRTSKVVSVISILCILGAYSFGGSVIYSLSQIEFALDDDPTLTYNIHNFLNSSDDTIDGTYLINLTNPGYYDIEDMTIRIDLYITDWDYLLQDPPNGTVGSKDNDFDTISAGDSLINSALEFEIDVSTVPGLILASEYTLHIETFIKFTAATANFDIKAEVDQNGTSAG